MLFVTLLASFAACSTTPPTAASTSNNLEDNSSVVDSQSLPNQPYYYTCIASLDYDNNEFEFLYGLERNAVAEAASSYRGEHPSSLLPVGVMARPVSTYYYATFAGYGVLAGIIWNDKPWEMRLDISRDGGANWEQTTLPLEPFDLYSDVWLDFGFTSPTDGWITVSNQYDSESASVHIITTHDSGKTWRQASEHRVSDYSSMLFTTAEHGYMGARVEQGGPILETWDGGDTWQSCPVSLPPNFISGKLKGYVVEFLRNEQGYYCVFSGVLAGADESREWASSVEIALSPQQNGKNTVWGFEESWNFPPQINPAAFFQYVNKYLYYPDYFGVDYNDDKSSLNHGFLHDIQDYAFTYKPDSVTETDTEYVFSRQLVADLIALIYNNYDFDVTTLTDYRSDVQGFTISKGCGHGGIFQDAVYHSVRVAENGDIELIRDVGNTSEEPGIRRGSGYYQTLVQRCVFRHVTSASGAELFTLMECEYLNDYPYTAQ